jgi:chorismate dehydratase
MTNPRIKISVVSYLNSKPFILALRKARIEDDFELMLDIPSDCATKLTEGTIDIGLVPVSIIPGLKNAQIISEHCIAADGIVNSVLLVSNVPLDKIKRIYLDYQSRTSVKLAQILANKLWKINPEWLEAEPGYEEQIMDDIAGIIIGDRALIAKKKFPFVYDLSADWSSLTGLPFVFACWVANKDIPLHLIDRLNQSLKNPQQFIPEVVSQFNSDELSPKEIEEYLNENIHYILDERKRKGLNLFLKFLQE